MEKELTEGLSQVQQLYVAIGALAGVILSLSGALVWMFLHGDRRTKEFMKISERTIESSINLNKTIEENTRVVRDLPHNIMLEIRAASTGGRIS